ncbi:MAG: ferritin-like domain-containing protein [Chloroflexota bacterium]|jgi:ferritin-like metal-binding protein YciE
MAITTPMDLFLYELSTILSVEQSKLQMMARLEQMCQDQQIKQSFSQEIPEIQRQITRVQECFRLLNARPLNITDHAVDCMQHDLQDFMQQNPNQNSIDMYSLGMVLKLDHYEVAAYMGLVEKARQLGQTQIVSLLEDNMSDERSSAQLMGQLSMRITGQMIQGKRR